MTKYLPICIVFVLFGLIHNQSVTLVEAESPVLEIADRGDHGRRTTVILGGPKTWGPKKRTGAESPVSCSSDEFACYDGTKCIPKSKVCQGELDDPKCDDLSHISAAQCNNCASDHLFLCQINGIRVCFNTKHQCWSELVSMCKGANELLSACRVSPRCSSNQFACHDGSKCIPKSSLCIGNNLY